MSRQPSGPTPATRGKTRRTRVVATIPGHFRQVQYWDDRVQVWCDYGDPVPRLATATLEAKRARCERGEMP